MARQEFVFVETGDGLLLEGGVFAPEGGIGKRIGVVWVHGFTGRFYSRTYVRMAEVLTARGYTLFSGNNRGHDMGTSLSLVGQTRRLGGGWWELLDESHHDIDAWLGFAVAQGFERLVLVGHSLGAMKVAGYLGNRADPRVVGLLLASGRVRPVPIVPEIMALAQRMVTEGKGEQLLPWGSLHVNTMSAQSYLSRTRFNVDFCGVQTSDAPISRVTCPIFACCGTVNETLTPDDLEIVRRAATAAPRVDTRVFNGASHGYENSEAEIGAAIADWIDTL